MATLVPPLRGEWADSHGADPDTAWQNQNFRAFFGGEIVLGACRILTYFTLSGVADGASVTYFVGLMPLMLGCALWVVLADLQRRTWTPSPELGEVDIYNGPTAKKRLPKACVYLFFVIVFACKMDDYAFSSIFIFAPVILVICGATMCASCFVCALQGGHSGMEEFCGPQYRPQGPADYANAEAQHSNAQWRAAKPQQSDKE